MIEMHSDPTLVWPWRTLAILPSWGILICRLQQYRDLIDQDIVKARKDYYYLVRIRTSKHEQLRNCRDF